MLAFVTTDGGLFCVGDGVVSGVAVDEICALLVVESVLEPELCSLPTLSFSPVSCTDHALDPPPGKLLVFDIWSPRKRSYTYPDRNHYMENCTENSRLDYSNLEASHRSSNSTPALWPLQLYLR